MQKLRSKRNKKANSKLDIFGKRSSIIDSSQIVGATVVLRSIKKQVERARKREVTQRLRHQGGRPGALQDGQFGAKGRGDLGAGPPKILSDQGRVDPTGEHGET